MELRQLVDIARKWLWVILACAALAGLGAAALSRLQPPTYRASTLLLVEPLSSTSYEPASVQANTQLARTYAQRLIQTPVLDAVATQLKLGVSGRELEKRVSATSIRDTQLIRVTVDDTQPERAQAIANLIPQVFNERDARQQQQRVMVAVESINQELDNLKRQIDTGQVAPQPTAAADQPVSRRAGTPQTDGPTRETSSSDLAGPLSLYTELVKRQQDMWLSGARLAAPVIVDAPAELPTEQISPRPLRNGALGAAAGLLVGIALAWLLEAWRNTGTAPQ